MSLNVYLMITRGAKASAKRQRIFIRENGRNIEIPRGEWDRRHPDREPVSVSVEEADEVYNANITHNLNTMATEAGIYEHLWQPGLIGVTTARELIEPLREGLALLESDPERFKKFNPANGWGDYEGFCVFVEEYLAACEKHPDAKIRVSR